MATEEFTAITEIVHDQQMAEKAMNERSKHTPLPWRVIGGSSVVGSDADNRILWVTQWAKERAEYEANAHLVVTAVNAHKDLLAACKEARVFAIEEIHDIPPKSRAPSEWSDFLDLVEAAIAKAEAAS